MGPMSLASILGSAGPQAFDPMELLSLFQQGGMPQLPTPPSPVQSFGGLPQEVQGQGNRQGILTLATLLGAASPGQIGTSIAQAAGAIDPIRRGFTDDYNQREMERYQVESQKAQMEAAFAAEQQERQRREQMTQAILARAGELAQEHPESGAEIRDLLLSSGGDPQAAMGALMDWQAQKEQEAAQAEQQATLANALSERGIPGEMGMFPSQAGNLMEESAMRDLGLGRYEPEPPPKPERGTWTSIGSGFVINNLTGETRRAYEPPEQERDDPWEGRMADMAMDIYTADQKRYAEEVFADPEAPPPISMDEAFETASRLRGQVESATSRRTRGLPERDEEGASILRNMGRLREGADGPGGPQPSFGVTPPPAPEPSTGAGQTSVESKLQAIERTASGMGIQLTQEDIRIIKSDLLKGATVQQVMQQLLGGG